MQETFWKNKKVLVTGGAGFIGSHLVDMLVARGSSVTVLDNLSNGTLKNIEQVKKFIVFQKGDCTKPEDALVACKNQDIVMNLAARVGGIEYNRTHQGTMLRDNLNIDSIMIEAARLANVERYLVVSSACVYPHDASIPTPESEGFRNAPEETNGGYGWAKRMGEKLGQYYADEFGMKIAIVRPYNAYGPRDHFESTSSHVIPSLIKRVVNGENPVVVWGSGKQSRAFLYAEDFAEGLMLGIERYPTADPVNLGTDEEISIEYLVKKVIEITGKKAKISFDTTKPDGSPRRNSDNTLAHEKLGFVAKTSLSEGLKKTIAWYLNEKK